MVFFVASHAPLNFLQPLSAAISNSVLMVCSLQLTREHAILKARVTIRYSAVKYGLHASIA